MAATAKQTGVLLLLIAGAVGLWLVGKSNRPGGLILPAMAALKEDKTKAGPTLANLRAQLARCPKKEAVEIIRRFLDSGADAATGLAFAVGAGGRLKTAPTLRLFLLDFLDQLDPAASAAYARTILSRQDSADEWAIALCNIARHRTDSRDIPFLEEKFREMTQHEAWQKSPSVGFLEAFDLPVHLGRTNLVPDLARLVQKQDNQAMAHAAFLALDRMVIANPDSTLSLLRAEPSLMTGREVTRANYFARANVQDPNQRQLLETYLINPALGSAELDKFAGLFPNANYMVSDNLLTRVATPDGASLTRHDAAALAVVNQWLLDPRFAARKPQLTKVQQRLEEFVRQAGSR